MIQVDFEFKLSTNNKQANRHTNKQTNKPTNKQTKKLKNNGGDDSVAPTNQQRRSHCRPRASKQGRPISQPSGKNIIIIINITITVSITLHHD